MNKNKIKVKVGDVFLIPIDDATVGAGCAVLDLGELLYLVVYEGRWSESEPPTMKQVKNLPITFAAVSNDAKLCHKDWPIIGNNRDGVNDIAKPVFKVYYFDSDSYFVEDIRKDKSRPATEQEIELLTNRFSITPIIFEKALRAFYGEIEWQPRFDRLLYSEVVKRSKVAL